MRRGTMLRILLATLVLVVLFPQPTEARGKDAFVLNADFVGRQHTLSGDSKATVHLRVYTSGGTSSNQDWTLPNNERPIGLGTHATDFAVEDLAAPGRMFFDAGFSCPTGGLFVEYKIARNGDELLTLYYMGKFPLEATGTSRFNLLPGSPKEVAVNPVKTTFIFFSQQGNACGGATVLPHQALRRQLGLP